MQSARSGLVPGRRKGLIYANVVSMADTMLRVGDVNSDEILEMVRDALDEFEMDYEHVRSEPEDRFPQTAYFYVSSDLSGDIEYVLGRLGEKHGFDSEIL